MWNSRLTVRAARQIAYALVPQARPSCRRCLTRITNARRQSPLFRHLRIDRQQHRAAVTQAANDVDEDFVSRAEEENGTLLEAAYQRVQEYYAALNNPGNENDIQQQKKRSKTLKELGPLAQAWESYGSLRKAIIETRANLNDPDPTMREMFANEHDELVKEIDNLVMNILPQILLPGLPAAPLPAVMTLTAGIGGGESARFVEEMSKMYTKYAESKGWDVKILSASEGAMAKGTGGNGFREMTIQFSPAEYAEEGAECFGELMWEKGTHRVQRVPPGATVDKMQSSTININVSPVYADTDEEPLVDPKDVKEDTMRARGPGGQHVNKTESAIRLVHIPTGITVSMQDSRSQGQNRSLAWEVLRARLSERKRQEEQDRRNASRIDAIKHSARGDKVRTYNYAQDRISDHRIGFSTSGLDGIMSGENFGVLVEALKKDLAERRMEALLRGEEDLLE